MKHFLLGAALLLTGPVGLSQIVTTDPVLPQPDKPVTITVDVSGTSLAGFAWNNTSNPVYLWAWLKNTGTADVDAPTNVNPATSAQDGAKCTRISTNPDKYQITITPTTFFNKPANQITKIGIKLKSRNWSDNKQTDNDRFFDVSQGLTLIFSQPTSPFVFVNSGDNLPITANTSIAADITLKVNGVVVSSAAQSTSISFTRSVSESSGTVVVTCDATAAGQTKSTSFSYTVRAAVVDQVRPTGIVDGINYSSDATKATLSLWAPGKSSVYVIGDFSNWEVSASNQMKRDGEHFWLEVTGLTPGQEYGFQYLVGESLLMADPYADRVLDPDDAGIPAGSYPGLKPYPAKALRDSWYFNRVAVLQTNQTLYAWKINNFQKPPKEKLVIYELLIRDFMGSDARTYQRVADTLSYLKRLGVNAIELMPVTEFNGNDSWGYNPTFMFAPDKYYGPRQQFKALVDKCHELGIAVIMDLVMNHHDLPNPYVMMDFDFTAMAPTANNKWFNVKATHPFSVFYDMNHESAYTRKYLDSVNYYWLHEYRIDGYRYDLSKGFTQKNNPDNVSAWGAYDASRIAILKRMANRIWSHTPDAYVILEHFADNVEEKELAEYRSGEGKGMMLWANHNSSYNQNTMGYASNSDFSGIYYGNRGWSVPGAVGYMESHDEERLMYKNVQFGNSTPDYTAKNVSIGLSRMEAANVLFLTVPGPKMIWQFGELGYDFSINTCADGSVNSSCRISAKQVKWTYKQEGLRKGLYTHIADLTRLRRTYPLFTQGTATFSDGGSLLKQIAIKGNPYNGSPSTPDQMNAVVVANFDVVKQVASVAFPHAGTWYDYYGGGASVTINSLSFSQELLPGQYRLYTDVKITNPVVTGLEPSGAVSLILYPNPASNTIQVMAPEYIEEVTLISLGGARIAPARIDRDTWSVQGLAKGLYVVQVRTASGNQQLKLIKE
ncbi:MAG: alpha-amylase family glycosyl hydrolase [Cyclobacteriaceae bacterium]|nr:alpha-amylase [Cytophagales bacterium]HNP77682.1 alpha-amylase family glycosyl hydrolase [Cyclobacteriaceae bacterium]HQQ82679.1 alpha-amylase family glycosyl hydrolase [Cyclobacteriaceae bacterium]